MMRASVVMVALLGVAACTAQVPDSGAGVGFQDYNSYLRNREASSQPAPDAAVTPGFSTDSAAAALDRADGVAAPATTAAPMPPAAPLPPVAGVRPRGGAPIGIKEETGEVDYATGGVSDEQDFAAVSARETIESDKARIAANRSQYVVVQPGALPQRQGEAGPNIVEFALATNNAPGTPLYTRSRLRVSNPDAACAKYGSPDVAQEAFLAAGGPDRDRKGLDPDGDGFACSWDPRPFRTALQ